MRSNIDTKRLQPMHPVDRPITGDEEDFIHEIKWDGYRVLAYLDDGKVRLESRNGRNLNSHFPQLVELLRARSLQAILDGEVVAVNREGRVDFSLLRSNRNSDVGIYYVVFDLLAVQNQDLCPKPWFERRRQLECLLKSEGQIIVSPLLPGSAADCLSFAASHDHEGIVSKQRNSPYLPGKRSLFWRKQKIRRTIDCVLVGAKVEAKSIRSLAVGLYQKDGSLFFLGNVGSGLGQSELDLLQEAIELIPITGTDECPCVNPPADAANQQWFQPLLVVEVEYFELTQSKRLRHPVFLRFRFDKKPEECLMEESTDDN